MYFLSLCFSLTVASLARQFGGNNNDRDNIVSVSMDRKTILLYNLDDPENALELAFQQRYGHIVSFKWFAGGYIMVGFSQDYLVVISTRE